MPVLPPLGTAPRLVGGVWRTRTGRTLTPAGQHYWDLQLRQHLTDGRGHMLNRPEPTVRLGRAGIKPPTFFEKVQASVGHNPDAARRQRLFEQTRHQPHYNPKTAQSTAADARLQAQNPHLLLDTIVSALSPYTAAKETVRAARHHNIVGAGIAATGILPFGKGRQAVKAIKEAEEVTRAAKAAKALEPAEEVLGKFQGARPGIHAQEHLRRAERKARLARGEEAQQAAGGGVAGHYAAKAALKGELPKINFSDLSDLDAETLHKLTNAVYEHPELKRFDKIKLADAILKAREGVRPREHEIKLMEKAFGPQAAEEFAKQTFGQKAVAGISNVLNVPRSILSTGDVSASLRQGLVALFLKPKAWKGAQGPQFRALLSEKNSVQLRAALEADPHFETAVEHGLAVTDMENVLHREEAFASNLAEKITGSAKYHPLHLVGVKHGPVRAAGRAYTTFLNTLRLTIWKDLVESVGGVGVATPKQMKDAAKVANWATGRGSVGKFEKSASILNATFFSPRLAASRIQAFNPVFYYRLDPTIRKQALGATLKMVGTGSLIISAAALAGAKVGVDPRSADWGKIKIGNTRFDIWGGHQQYARLLAQVATGQVVSSTDGKLIVHGGWGGRGGAQVIGRFVRGKLTPTTSFAVDWFANSDYSGQPLSWKKEVLSRSIPLLMQDTWDVAHSPGGFPAALGAYGIGATGIGVQSYGPPLPKPRKQDSVDEMIDKYLGKTGSSGSDVDQMIEDYLNR